MGPLGPMGPPLAAKGPFGAFGRLEAPWAPKGPMGPTSGREGPFGALPALLRPPLAACWGGRPPAWGRGRPTQHRSAAPSALLRAHRAFGPVGLRPCPRRGQGPISGRPKGPATGFGPKGQSPWEAAASGRHYGPWAQRAQGQVRTRLAAEGRQYGGQMGMGPMGLKAHWLGWA